MFCVKCGNEMSDGALFCAKCGAAARPPKPADEVEAEEGPARAGAVTEAEPAPISEADSGQTPAQDFKIDASSEADTTESPSKEECSQDESFRGEDPQPKKRGRGKIVGIAIACVVVAAAIGVGVWWLMWYQPAHTMRTFNMLKSAPDFDERATAIPVEVSGVDATGAAVDDLQFIEPDGGKLELLPGSYDLTFAVGYATGDAHIAVPDRSGEYRTTHVEVGVGDSPDGTLDVMPAFELLADDEVDESDIDAILDNAARNPNDGGKAEELCSVAKKHCEFAKTAKKNAEGFLRCVYDLENNSEGAKGATKYMVDGKYFNLPSATTRIKNLSISVESDSKITYKADYESKAMNSGWTANSASGCLVISSDGKVDGWYVDGNSKDMLYGSTTTSSSGSTTATSSPDVSKLIGVWESADGSTRFEVHNDGPNGSTYCNVSFAGERVKYGEWSKTADGIAVTVPSEHLTFNLVYREEDGSRHLRDAAKNLDMKWVRGN